MIKRKTFYGSVYSPDEQRKFDTKVNVFLNELSENGWGIINYNTMTYSHSNSSGFNSIRTEIVYLETPTRKVLFEKQNKNT